MPIDLVCYLLFYTLVHVILPEVMLYFLTKDYEDGR
jgi:hypothetical protein